MCDRFWCPLCESTNGTAQWTTKQWGEGTTDTCTVLTVAQLGSGELTFAVWEVLMQSLLRIDGNYAEYVTDVLYWKPMVVDEAVEQFELWVSFSVCLAKHYP